MWELKSDSRMRRKAVTGNNSETKHAANDSSSFWGIHEFGQSGAIHGTDNVEILPVPLQQHPHSGRRMPPLTGCQVQCQALGVYLLIYPQTVQESETYSDPFSD